MDVFRKLAFYTVIQDNKNYSHLVKNKDLNKIKTVLSKQYKTNKLKINGVKEVDFDPFLKPYSINISLDGDVGGLFEGSDLRNCSIELEWEFYPWGVSRLIMNLVDVESGEIMNKQIKDFIP